MLDASLLDQRYRGGFSGGSAALPLPAPADIVARAAGFARPADIILPPLTLGSSRAPRLAPVGACAVPVPRGFTRAAAYLKRAADIACAAALLALVLPLLIVVAMALRLESPGPLLFVQRRVGRGGRPFGCIKLRTMRADADVRLAELLASSPRARKEWAADHKLRDDPRVSPLGRLVRRLSLDELPQLVNVLAGEMSMVGPRPIVQAEIARYGAFFADYCAVKPGLTGLWQVSGRNDVPYAERVQFDRHYARHASLLLDLRIVLRTFPAVLGGAGTY